ncbi:E3 ubiquitin-protein ligase UBR7 [Oopsacas minuta]|uniref:E3 ubiquitin-protein ligase UBR7 n=1 Tax=Oopsacas minuta TaxID=111878 RepID=A0AAV7JFJ2_9METZ|nr:E3 ubiquitin-protein ligase UBR7 [Oopsacas minuta]
MAEEVTYSIDDIIQGEVELEQEANVILGSASDQHCSYEQGYLYRQPVFSCITCRSNEPNKPPGGVCLACSLVCHNKHEVEELYTKRFFRCDCGNKDKFGHLPEAKCQLQPNKSDCNELNIYCDNFRGLYCTCKKVFDGETEMIQCIICEDWFHLQHCGLENSDCIDEFICPLCMDDNTFLRFYVDNAKTEEATKKIVENIGNKSVNEDLEGTKVLADSNPPASVGKMQEPSPDRIEKPSEASPHHNLKRKAQAEEPDAKRVKESLCKIENYINIPESKPGIYNNAWRQELCRCGNCLLKYKSNKIEFLLEQTDTITYYEQQAKHTSSFSNSVEAFKEILNPTQRNELLYQFNHMKEDLNDFLRPFAQEGRVVSKEDIQKFFEDLTKERERLRDSGIPPDTCK